MVAVWPLARPKAASRRVATRHDETASSYLGVVHLTAIRLWLRHFVDTAYAGSPSSSA
jgi:transposase